MTALRTVRRLARALADRRGGTAVFFALATPVLITIVCGAIDLVSVNGDKGRTQDVADAAALMAAKQLGVADVTGVKARVKDFVDEGLAPLKSRFSYSVSTVPTSDRKGVTVTVQGRRLSFFANLLPPGGWKIRAEATASAMGQVPLCVLSSGSADALQLDNESKITANHCMVHGNADIAVNNTAWLQAGMVQAAGLATGRISPAPQAGAPPIDDPFTAMNLNPPKTLQSVTAPLNGLLGGVTNLLCNPVDLLFTVGVQVLQPGVHCGRYRARKNATVKLMPGEHYFLNGRLELTENATLLGDDVALIFDDSSEFRFADSSVINLSGRKSGSFAGFVLATTRKNTGDFEISSDNARQLLGAIYIPSATLHVTGKGNKVADQSAWTVVIAKSIKMTGSPDLVINANYAGSSVPVPTGVGPSTVQVALVH
jgi:hypothetical protein